MIIWPTHILGQSHNYPYNNLIIDWTSQGVVPPPVVPQGNWTLAYQLLFNGIIILWGSSGQYSGYGNVNGTSGGGGNGHLQFIYNDKSLTLGTVQPFSDGVITVPSITVNTQLPIVLACRQILAAAGIKAQPYKLDIIKNGVTLFTIRSILWGTVMITGTDPGYQVIDLQTQTNAVALV